MISGEVLTITISIGAVLLATIVGLVLKYLTDKRRNGLK
jgi:ABC-type Fe3+ transport system permease subunit